MFMLIDFSTPSLGNYLFIYRQRHDAVVAFFLLLITDRSGCKLNHFLGTNHNLVSYIYIFVVF